MLHQTKILADPNGFWAEHCNSTKDVVFVVQDCNSMYAVKACFELLKLANRFSSETKYRIEVVRSVESAFSLRSNLSKRTVILFGGLRKLWPLSEIDTRLLRTHLPCADRIGLVGGAVLFAAQVPFFRNYGFCIHTKFSEAADEEAIQVIAEDVPAYRDGKVHSATGELAALHMIGSMVADDCGEFLAQQILSHIGLTFSSSANRSEAENHYLRLAKGNSTLCRAIAMMKQNVEEPLYIESLSQALEASPRQVQRKFQLFFGETPTSVYLNIRLERAYHLLKFTDLPIDEVSIATGFTSRSSFNLRFRRRYDTTPIRCRASRYQ
ncbi:helix-turn-helix domain-containing protein [Ruegeria arenilitoris]|uniref:helix-turn-helix domain-containing protein n=1 Tax=Ruegeria arenilitoris TaxID=1173585 RepID=UPI001480988D|nr:helix-turn-helix domain-containing protein [Ruegeria arenilitoris]